MISWMDFYFSSYFFINLILSLLFKKSFSQAYVDGIPALSSKDRKATLREFYGMFSLVFLGYRNSNLLIQLPFLLPSCSSALIWHYFAAVIYPLLRQLGEEFIELEYHKKGRCTEVSSRKRVEDRKMVSDKDLERDDECGICMECCTKMVLPNCGHALCINCFHDWYS